MLRNKRSFGLLLVLLLLASLVLVACGDDDDDDNGDNGNGDDGVNLSQSLEGSGLTVSYPEDWAGTYDADAEQILLANSQEALDRVGSDDPDAAPQSGEAGMVIQVLPLEAVGMAADTPLDEIFELITGGMTGEGMETRGDVQDIQVNGQDAKRLDVRDSETGSEGFVVGYVDDGALILIIVLTAEGEAGDVDATALAIIDTVEYAPVADEAAEAAE